MNMMISKTAVVVAALACTAVGLAASASAELTDGTYQVTYSDPGSAGEPPLSVSVTSCGTGCKRTHVSSGIGYVDIHLDGNTWSGLSDGHPLIVDNNTLAGSSDGLPCQWVKVG